LVAVGLLSYSLYLWQQPLLILAGEGTAWWQHFPQNAILLVPFAVASYFLIERPFLALRSRVSRCELAGSLPK
jgi:peptidoglycan/LPS O-acetylase OafA/YrhL